MQTLMLMIEALLPSTKGVRGQQLPSPTPWKMIRYFHSRVVHLGRSTCQGELIACAPDGGFEVSGVGHPTQRL